MSFLRLKKIDLYIVKKFLGTYFFAILIIISIAVVFDLSEKVEDFIEKEAPLRAIVFNYYLNFIPYFANLFSSLFTFIAVIFFTSKMAYNTEIIAILSSGVSFRRMMYPYFVSALIIAIFSFLLMAYIIPPANEERITFEYTYIRNPIRNTDKDIHRQIEPGLFVYMKSYNVSNDIGYKFAIENFKDGVLRSKLTSDYVKWDSTSAKWTIRNYFIRFFQVLSCISDDTVIVRRNLLIYNDYGNLFLDKLLLSFHPNVILDFDDDLSNNLKTGESSSLFGKLLMENRFIFYKNKSRIS